MKQDFYVTEGRNRRVLLGADFHDNHGLRVYHDLMTMKLKNSYIPLERDIHVNTIVRSCSTVQIKPRTAEK